MRMEGISTLNLYVARRPRALEPNLHPASHSPVGGTPRTFQEPEPNLLQCAKNGMLFKIKTARCVQHDRFSKLLIKSFHLHRRLQNGSLACKNYHSIPPSLPRAWTPRRFCAPKPLPRIAPRKLPRRQQYHLAAMSNG